MRLHLLGLLLAVASSTSVESVESADSTHLQSNNVRGGRNLRQHPSATQGDDEDRAFTALVTEGVTNWLKASKVTWADDQLEALVKKGTSADDALKLLKLDDELEKLLSRKNLETWKTFVNKLNQQNPENQVTMMSAIINKYGEGEVARMIAVAKSKTMTESVATDLQVALFKHWILEKKRPDSVWQALGILWKNVDTDPAYKMWWAYVDEYAKAAAKGIVPL